MVALTAEGLIEMVEIKYFANVDQKNMAAVVDCFTPDATLTIQTADVTHSGHGEIRRMFNDFLGSTKTIYHGDFRHVVDVDNQCIASQFVAKNSYDDGRQVEMRNCNFFRLEDGLFKTVTIYMSDESPLV